MDEVTTYVEYARDRIAQGEMRAAQETLDRGLEYVRSMHDLNMLLVAAYPHFDLTGTGARFGDDVYVEQGDEGVNVLFTNDYRNVSQLCHYQDLYKLVQFMARFIEEW